MRNLVTYRQCIHLTCSLLLTVYLYPAFGDHFDAFTPHTHPISPGIRSTCNVLLLWPFIHLGCIAALAVLLHAWERFLDMCCEGSRHAKHAAQVWVAHAFDATRHLRHSIEELNEHVSVDMIVDPAGDSPPISAPPCATVQDAFEEWNDLLADAGLCDRPGSTWEDAWSDVSEPVAPASPPSKFTHRPFKLVVATPKTPVKPQPTTKCDEQTSEAIRLRIELHAAQKECARSAESRRRSEKENRELRDLSHALRTQLDDATQREAALQTDVARAREETASAKKELALEQKRAEELARARSAAQSYADSLHTELQRRHATLTACAEEMRSDKAKSVQLAAHVAFFQKQALRLRAELDAQRPPPPGPPRTFPVVRLRTQPLARPTENRVSMSSWSPGEYLRQLKRQEYAHRVYVQKAHEQAEGAVKRLRAELGTLVAQRDELKAENDRLYTQVRALKRDAKAVAREREVRVQEGESETAGDELVAAVAQRDELLDEVVVLQAENAALRHEVLGAQTVAVAAQDELVRLRGEDANPSAISNAAGTAGPQASIDIPSVAAARGELSALCGHIDSAYAPLGPVMAARLAARGIVLQREPRHDEKVTMISEFALYLLAAAASPPEAALPTAPEVSPTSSARDPASRRSEASATVASASAAVDPTRSEKASPTSRSKRAAGKATTNGAKPAASPAVSTVEPSNTETIPSIPSASATKRPATKSPQKAKAGKANPRKEPAPATSPPPPTTQPTTTLDVRRSSNSPPSLRSSAADLAARAAAILASKQLADTPSANAVKMVARAKALAQLRQLGGLSASSSSSLKSPLNLPAFLPMAGSSSSVDDGNDESGSKSSPGSEVPSAA